MRRILSLILLTVMAAGMTGCQNTAEIRFPFSKSDIETIEVFRRTAGEEAAGHPYRTVKTPSDIQALYTLFTERITVQNRRADDALGSEAITFLFHLKNGKTFDLTYYAQGVKNGRLNSLAGQFDYSTSADIAGIVDGLPIEETETTS